MQKKMIGVFVSGVLCGALIGAAIVYKLTVAPFHQMAADSFVSSVMYDTQTALRLRQNKPSEISRRLESSLPNNVLMLHNAYASHPMTPKALKNIRFFYQTSGLAIPTEIAPILNAPQ